MRALPLHVLEWHSKRVLPGHWMGRGFQPFAFQNNRLLLPLCRHIVQYIRISFSIPIPSLKVTYLSVCAVEVQHVLQFIRSSQPLQPLFFLRAHGRFVQS